MFPARAGRVDGSVDHFVAECLRSARDLIYPEIEVELACNADQATKLTDAFLEQIADIRRLLDTDIDASYAGDPAARSIAEVLVCYPGVHAMMHYRIAHALHGLGLIFIARIVAELGHAETGIDIHPGATIGASCFVDHGTGVVIGETAIIGRNVRIYQHVTLGAKKLVGVNKGVARHPIVEDDVVIYSGASILGRITVGRGSVIGGGVWLTRSLPPNSFITQAQSQYENYDDGAGI